MEVKELDVVRLADGRQATILDVYEGGKAFLVEVADGQGRAVDIPIVGLEKIKAVIWQGGDRRK